MTAGLPTKGGLIRQMKSTVLAAPITVGTTGYTDTGILEQITGNSNSYQQFVTQNLNAGSTASADHIVSNNLGTATTYYGDFGINSSTFSGTGNLAKPNAVYLTATTGDLALGTTTSNAIHFVINNGATDAMTIATTGVVTIPAGITGTINVPSSAISTAQLDKTSDTTLAAITGLSIPLVASGKYIIEAYIPCTSNASGGVKVALGTSDTLTATSINYTAFLSTAAACVTASTTTLGTGLGSTAAVISADIMGTIVVNAAGTLIVQFAQNASFGTASSAYVNGWVRATRIA